MNDYLLLVLPTVPEHAQRHRGTELEQAFPGTDNEKTGAVEPCA